MKLSRPLKITGAVVGSLLGILVIALVLIIHSDRVRKSILDTATEYLTEQLGTTVTIEDVEISLLHPSIILCGLKVEDQEHRPMLQMERLSVYLKLKHLLDKRITVEEAEVSGLEAMLLKPKDGGTANFQFVIDAFSKNNKKKEPTVPADTLKKKHRIALEVDLVNLHDIHLRYNESEVRLQDALLSLSIFSNTMLEVHHLDAAWESVTKKGPISNTAHVKQLTGRIRRGHQYDLTLEGLHYLSDNHKPRKNTGKPKHGFFDTGHFDVTANLQVLIDSIASDTLRAHLLNCTAVDSVSGIDIRDLRTRIYTNYRELNLEEVTFQQKNTILQVPEAQFILPSKKEGRPFSYTTGTITGRTLLKDISRTFAPVLANFDYPLNLTLQMNGDSAHIDFRNIHVFSDDHKLNIDAYGSLHHFKPKEALDINFHIIPLTVRRGVADRIINQFTVKKLMMKQLDNLGDIRYNGLVTIRYKNEHFQGTMETAAGPIDVEFGIDGINKYLSGKVKSEGFALGDAMGMEKSLGDMICEAEFKVDISKQRTAAIRKGKGGKLPIGHVNATIEDCSYIGIHIRNLSATIESDGAEAIGDIYQHGKRRDLYCTFIIDDTDDMQKMKIRNPGIKFHKLSEEDRQAAEERKLQKAEERAAKKEQRALEKEQKAAEKAAKKAAKEAEKAAKKEAEQQTEPEKTK